MGTPKYIVRSKVSFHKAGHCNLYNKTVQGHNMAIVTVLSDGQSRILDGHIYMVSIRVGEIFTLS